MVKFCYVIRFIEEFPRGVYKRLSFAVCSTSCGILRRRKVYNLLNIPWNLNKKKKIMTLVSLGWLASAGMKKVAALALAATTPASAVTSFFPKQQVPSN